MKNNIKTKSKIEFTIKSLNKIKDLQERHRKLYKLGVDLIEFETSNDLLVESLAFLWSDSNKKKILIEDWINWWLYENVDKVVYLKNGKITDVNSIKDFVNFISKYK